MTDQITVHIPTDVERTTCAACDYKFTTFRVSLGLLVSHSTPAFCPSCGASFTAPPPALVTYAQRDPRWKDELLGFGAGTIGKYGCVLCCMTMASVRADNGFGVNPGSANVLIKAANGFGGTTRNLMRWEVGGAALGLEYQWYHKHTLSPAHVEKVIADAEVGGYVLIKVDWNPGTPTLDEHWVLIREHLGDGQFLIDDPWTGGVHEFPPAYCKRGWDAARGIFGAVSFRGDGS